MTLFSTPLNHALFAKQKASRQATVARLLSASRLLIAAITLTSASIGFAQMPSPGQMAQLKAMSPSEQKALAESVGIDIGSMAGQSTNQPDLSEPGASNNDNSTTQENNDKSNTQEDGEAVDGSEQKNANKKARRAQLPIFGLDLFKGDPDSFNPATNIPVPSEYQLGSGDRLIVQLYGKENVTHNFTINREGQIQFPQIGPISFAGLTFNQAQELINTTVSERMVGVKASVTMGALRTIRVFVLGEVKRPGSFTVGSLATMTNALFASGGITKVGSLRAIQLKRNGKLVTTMDMYDLLLGGSTNNDSRLMQGDVIFVPPVKTTIEISGSVNRPARYEVKDSHALAAVVAMAGGLTNTSHAATVAITRINSIGERSLFNVDLNQEAGKNFQLESGDQVSIGGALDYINNQITVNGSAKRPGVYSWKPNLRFTDIIATPFDVMPGTDINIALRVSMSPETGRIETHVFSPSAAWDQPNSAFNPKLQGYDEVYLFDLTGDRPKQLARSMELIKQQARFQKHEQVVHASGSVKFPGTYPLTVNMTTEELIQLAGGLTESAFGSTGEITRYTISEGIERVVTHLNVDFNAEPIALSPSDTLNIKQVPLWKKRETVTLHGEVMFPGIYAIVPGETLMDVLKRAGGLSPYAHPKGAVFSREDLRLLEQERLDELRKKLKADMAIANRAARTGQKEFSEQDTQALLDKLKDASPLGRMVIDLPRVLEDPANQDFPLENGDVLTIPRDKPSVTVIGEVQYPTSHFFDSRLNSNEYIKRSGGTKKHADKKRIYVVKANGRVIEPSSGSKWFTARSNTIEPGDTIVVPVDTERVDSLEIWAKSTQILYQIALGAAAINSL